MKHMEVGMRSFSSSGKYPWYPNYLPTWYIQLIRLNVRCFELDDRVYDYRCQTFALINFYTIETEGTSS